MQQFLSEGAKITVVAPVTAGTSTITGSALNMAGFDGVLFLVSLGTPATDNTVKITQCDTSGGSYADLTGTSVGASATDTPLIVDLKYPREQFLKYVVTRATSTTIDTVVIIQYKAAIRAVTQPTNTQVERWNGPAEGTA
jgi:hypothetical protein